MCKSVLIITLQNCRWPGGNESLFEHVQLVSTLSLALEGRPLRVFGSEKSLSRDRSNDVWRMTSVQGPADRGNYKVDNQLGYSRVLQ